jgi:hypothetical protein
METAMTPPSFWERLYDEVTWRVSLLEDALNRFTDRIAPRVLKGECLDKWLDFGAAENHGWNVFLYYFCRMCWKWAASFSVYRFSFL